MCGIVGYVGSVRAALRDELLAGLTVLEYRGYDSAGLALGRGDGTLAVARAAGELTALRAKVRALPPGACMGLGHTRWATHGEPSEANAHPRTTRDGKLALVLNGIVENDLKLRRELEAAGVTFATPSDAETLLEAIAHAYLGDLGAAVAATFARLEGSLAIAVVHADHPDEMVVARRGSPLAVGKDADGAWWIASDAVALALGSTSAATAMSAASATAGAELEVSFAYLADDTVLCLAPHSFRLLAGTAPVLAPRTEASRLPSRDGYDTFMRKEIHEQPTALARARAATQPLDPALLHDLDRVVAVGCGSAFYAASVAKILVEDLARLPAEAAVGSELRLTRPLLTPRTLVIAFSQSGETADTLACVRLAKASGARVLAVCNVPGSSIAREAHALRPLGCGQEIGVASTKAYTAMLLQAQLLAAEIAGSGNGDLGGIAHLATSTLASAFAAVPAVLRACEGRTAFAFLGRHVHYATACEGALKLRELAYVNAEAFAAGELKHGSIALLDRGYPVVAVAPRNAFTGKMLATLQEVRARGALVIAVATAGDSETASLCDHVLPIPACPPALEPILATLPLQALAYGVGEALGRNLDKPRNLAKSVTVD